MDRIAVMSDVKRPDPSIAERALEDPDARAPAQAAPEPAQQLDSGGGSGPERYGASEENGRAVNYSV